MEGRGVWRVLGGSGGIWGTDGGGSPPGAGAPQEGHFPISQTFFPKPDMGPEINFKEADDTGEAQKCPKGVGVSGAGGDGWCGDVRDCAGGG